MAPASCGVGYEPLEPQNQGVASFDRARRTVASNVRRRRIGLGLTQEDFAERANLDVRHVQKIEAGDVNLTLRTLSVVAKALRLSMRDLF